MCNITSSIFCSRHQLRPRLGIELWPHQGFSSCPHAHIKQKNGCTKGLYDKWLPSQHWVLHVCILIFCDLQWRYWPRCYNWSKPLFCHRCMCVPALIMQIELINFWINKAWRTTVSTITKDSGLLSGDCNTCMHIHVHVHWMSTVRVQ